MLVTYVDRCTTCSCSSLRDEDGPRPLPGVAGCGRSCRCHGAHSMHAAHVVAAQDADRMRFWRRARTEQSAVVAVR